MKLLLVKPSALVAPVGDGYVVYDVEEDQLHHLNPSAALIVELCDGSRHLDQIRAALLPLLGESGWEDCVRWIDEAERTGLLVSGPPAGLGGAEVSANRLVELADRLRSDDRVLAAFVCQTHAAELAPDEPLMWCRLGELAHIVGRRAEAREAYERYFERHPEDAEVEHILVALRDDAPPARASDQFIEQLYSRFASFYDTNMCDELEYRAPRRLFEVVSPTLAGRDQLDVLDLGCGTGLNGELLRAHARRLIGIDLSPQMIERAQERAVYDELHQAEITAWLEGCAARYDLIAACDTLIYFGDLRQVVLPAARRLSANGTIAFTVERGDNAPFQLGDSGRFTHHPDHLRAVAAETGLSVVGIEETVLRSEYGDPVEGLVAVFSTDSVPP